MIVLFILYTLRKIGQKTGSGAAGDAKGYLVADCNEREAQRATGEAAASGFCGRKEEDTALHCASKTLSGPPGDHVGSWLQISINIHHKPKHTVFKGFLKSVSSQLYVYLAYQCSVAKNNGKKY